MVSILVAVVLSNAVPVPPGPEAGPIAPTRSDGEYSIDSEALQARAMAAMLMPYHYGVTQMPCQARDWQPRRGWHPAREPSGRIEWVTGPATRVKWSGIYGTCFIQSPIARESVPELQRTSLECECNGWLPDR